jgi:rRNA maturation endonuclease Nob1
MISKRCPLCGTALDDAGRCTGCAYVDPAGIHETNVRRCPICGGSVSLSKCTRCQWREGAEDADI